MEASIAAWGGRVRAIAAAVCAAAPKEPQERRSWAELGPGVHRYHHPLIPDPDGGLDAPQAIAGFSREVPAGSRSLPVVVMVGQRSGPTLLIVAGEHGDEYEGMVAIHSLANTIGLSQLAGTIVAVVCCSMDAYLADAAKRFDWKDWAEKKATLNKVRVGQQKQVKKK